MRSMNSPAAKRQRSVDHGESTRNINVVKGGLSIMCPADCMGMLIGKGGSGLRGMQDKSGVKVTLQETKSMPENARERGVGLSGTLDNVAAVEKLIFEKLNARRVTSLAPSPAEEEFEDAYQAALAAEEDPNAPLDPDAPTDPLKVKVVRWVMDNTLCGWLIGKGGSGIQNIEATSGAEVRVATEKSMTKESGERIVYIKGNLQQREKALDLIRGNPKISGRVAAPNDPETAAVHVPSKAIGFILGHRGTSIQALTEKTGAQLRVAPASEITTGSSEHRVDITGGPRQVVAARHALAARVDEWKVTNNTTGAPDEVEYSLKIAVPQPLVGHLIGKGGMFVREVLAVTNVMVKVQQDSGSPTMWGDACCVMLSGTMSNVVSAQQMIMERIANIGDRLKEMVPNAVTLCENQDPDDPVKTIEVNIQLPDGPPPSLAPHPFQQPPFGQPPPFGFAPPFGAPPPFMQPGQPPFQQPPFQPPFQQPPPGQQPPFGPPSQSPQRNNERAPPPDNITFNSVRELRAPGLTRANKTREGLELLVDNAVVGSIIGKGGQTIRKVSTETGATIQVQARDDVSPSQLERRVTIASGEMVTLLKAANMICATLRNSERLAHAARHGGDEGGPPPGRNGPPRGHHPGSGPGQYNPSIVVSGPPPNSPAPTPAPAPFQQYQQPPPQIQYAPAPTNSSYPPQQFAAPQATDGVSPQQAYQQYPQQVQPQPTPQQQPPSQQQQQQAMQPLQQQPAAAAAAVVQATPAQYAPQQQQQQQQPPQQQPQQQPAGTVYYQQPQSTATNGMAQPGNPQAVQYAQAVQQQQQQPPQQQQQPPQQQQQQQPQHLQQQQQQQQQLPMHQQATQQQQQQQPQAGGVQQLPLQGQGQPAASAPSPAPEAAAAAAPVYGWVYDPATGTYTAAPAAAAPTPQASSYPAQPQYSQQR